MNSKFKSVVCFLSVVALCFTCYVTSDAADSSIAGNYYYTDIKTYLYYSPITAYNIGGKTVINAEILNWHYGFDVYWHPAERWLEIKDKGGMFNSLQAMSGSLCEDVKGKTGAVAGNYYKTDIVTTLNGNKIESYNIGGRTCIVAKEMSNFGYDVTWNEKEKTVTIKKPSDFNKIKTDFGTIKTMYNYDTSITYLEKYNRGIILTDKDQNTVELAIPSQSVLIMSGISYIKLSDICSALNASCTLVENEKTYRTEWVNGVTYDELHFEYNLDFSFDKNISLTFSKTKFEYKKEMIKDTECYGINPFSFSINGVNGYTTAYMDGEYQEQVLIIDNQIYIPTYMVAKMLGYSNAS